MPETRSNPCLNQQSETMRKFKTYEETYCGIKWFMRYMGIGLEGQCKWYIWSDDINFYEYNDTLWYSADEARFVARYIISKKQ
jgi:hypothetical protein